MSGVNAAAVERIAHAALRIMERRAANLEPGESFTAADIVSCVIADPAGETARYLAVLVETGITHYALFKNLHGGEA